MNYITSVGVQQFTITIASGQTTGTATITAVGSGAYIDYGGSTPSVAAQPQESQAYVTQTSSTVLTATRKLGTAGTIVISGSITDGDTTNLIKSVQYGTATIAATGTSGTAAISAVTNANTAIGWLGASVDSASLVLEEEMTTVSLSGTTVTASCPHAAAGNLVVGFCIREYQSSCLTANGVQNISATSSSSVTSFTASLGANVVLANAISVWGGAMIDVVTTNLANAMMYGTLTGIGTFTVNVNTAVADAKTYKASIVEHNSGVLNSSVQRGTTTLTGVVQATTSITSVNEAFAGLSWLGNTTNVTSSFQNEATTSGTLGYVPPGLVQAVLTSTLSAGGSATMASTGAGNLLVVMLAAGGASANITGIIDSASQNWVQVPSAKASNSTSSHITDIWYFPNTTSGVTSITISGTGISASSLYAEVYEFSGIKTTSPLDGNGVAANNQPTSTTPVSAAISTTVAGDVVLTNVSGSSPTTVQAPFTYKGAGNNATAYYFTPGIVSSLTATFGGVGGVFCSSAAAFELAALTQAVIVNKNNATGNATSSWELFEFPAFSGGGGGIVGHYLSINTSIQQSLY